MRWMPVERQVVGGERDVGGEQPLEPAAHVRADRARLVVPEHAVVHEQHLRALDRARSNTSSVEDTADATRSTSLGADHLHADGRVVAVAVRLELRVEEGQDLVAGCAHRRKSTGGNIAAGAALRPRQRIGVPRFELGTSPTRTERATRLRHTPEAPIIAHSRSSAAPALRRQKRTTCTCSPPGRVRDSPSSAERPDRERRADDR